MTVMSISPFCSNPVFSHLEYTCQEQTKRTPRERLLIVFPGIIQKVYENIGSCALGLGSFITREYSETEQIKLGTPIHLLLEELVQPLSMVDNPPFSPIRLTVPTDAR